MKKNHLMVWAAILSTLPAISQKANPSAYPNPEYNNEIYLAKKDSTISFMRLEKGTSKQEMKMKMMGMGGMDQGYELDGERSTVRLPAGSNLVFVLYTGSATAPSSNPQTDSMMRANGMDPNSMGSGMSGYNDPTTTTSLYGAKAEKGKRKILLSSMGLMGKSKKTATKYTFSVKKIREGLFELIVDKPLSRGEYAFVMMSMGSADQSFSLFAFAVD